MTDAAPGAPAPAASRVPLLQRPWVVPSSLFLFLMAVYLCDGGFMTVRDAAPNIGLPVQLLKRGTLSFSPEDAPFMFTWTFEGRSRTRTVSVRSWDAILEDRKTRDLLAAGKLTNPQPRYYLLPSAQPGRYVGIYGPGAGLSAVPYFAVLSVLYRGWSDNMAVLGVEAKVFASACIAGAAVALYFAFLLHTRRSTAVVAALVFGLGTCVWAELTQTLWQQTPTVLFVTLGLYFMLRPPGERRSAVLAGLFLALSVLCRPSLAILVAATGVYLLIQRRRDVLPFVLGAAGPILLLAAYNTYYLGAPHRMGQNEAARVVAMELNGSDDVWPTPLWEGLAGLLFSPSRGLFVFSPFLAFAVWGIVEVWRRPSTGPLRPWSVALLVLLLIPSKWFEWFGGWVFGYRLIAELAPLLMLFLIPVAERIRESKTLRTGFAVLAVVGISIQALGAAAYDPVGWHAQEAYEVKMTATGEIRTFERAADAIVLLSSGQATSHKQVPMDVATKRFRHRLWYVREGQIAYLLKADAGPDASESRKQLMEGASNEKMGPP